MELLKRYWWVVGGVLVLLVLMKSRGGSPGPTVTQIGGGADGLAIANLNAQTELAADQQRLNFAGQLLGYSLDRDRLTRGDAIERLRIESAERLGIRQAQASEVAAQYGYNANMQALNNANYQANLNYQLQLQALRRQGGNNTLGTILQGIFAGWDRVAPIIFDGGFSRRENSGDDYFNIFGDDPWGGLFDTNGGWSFGFDW